MDSYYNNFDLDIPQKSMWTQLLAPIDDLYLKNIANSENKFNFNQSKTWNDDKDSHDDHQHLVSKR